MFSEFLLNKYRLLFDNDTIRGLTAPLSPSIRANTLRINERTLVRRLTEKGIELEKISWVKHGYLVKDSPFSLGATTEYLMGYYQLQDPASMYSCEVLEPKKGEVILDMAAAPGGKTTYISQLMMNKGTIVSLELNRDRMRSLRSTITRMGAENVIAIRMDARNSGELGIIFDRILLDAPCTGTGTVFKNPEAGKKGHSDVETCCTLQASLIKTAHGILKKKGILVYSTCSILPEENELIIKDALNSGFKLLNVPYGVEAFTQVYGMHLGNKMKFAKRFYPHTHGTQGFFIAKLQKI